MQKKNKPMKTKKTFEIQLLSHVEGETQEEAIKEFLTDIIQRKYSDICGIGKDIAIDARGSTRRRRFI